MTVVASACGWLKARSRDEATAFLRSVGLVCRLLFGLLVLVVSLRYAWWMALSAPGSFASRPFGVAGFAACVSTAVTVSLVLLGTASTDPRRPGARSGGDAFRFWLISFAMIATITLLSALLARIPAELETPWLKAPRTFAVCPPDRSGALKPVGPAGCA